MKEDVYEEYLCCFSMGIPNTESEVIMEERPKTRPMTCEKPCDMLKGRGPYKAFYCKNREEFLYALFKMCVSKQISISNWQPYYESHRENFEEFKKAYSQQHSVVSGMPENIAYSDTVEVRPDWYIFQYYEKEYSYYSDKYEQNMKTTESHFNVTPLSVIKENMEQFLGQFPEESEVK